MRKRLERVMALVVLLGVLFVTPITALAQDQRVFDDAGLFSAEQTTQLEADIADARAKIGMDIVITTTTDTQGKDTQAYADDYYDSNGFGTGDEYDGVLLLIDMDNRQITISTCGRMIRYLTDDRQSKMLDHMFTYVGEEDFYGAASVFVQDVVANYDGGMVENQYNYNTETGEKSYYRSVSAGQILLFAVISLGVGVGICFVVKAKYQMKLFAGYKYPYRDKSRLQVTVSKDEFVNQFVTSRRIEKTPPPGSSGSGGGGRSSTHTSSSGRSHGGSSRGF